MRRDDTIDISTIVPDRDQSDSSSASSLSLGLTVLCGGTIDFNRFPLAPHQ
jgi:hypothetical protein